MNYLIKKYANRKLYDTVRRSYTTLAEIGELVRGGTEGIEVRDEASGKDITGAVMAQIILDAEEKKEERGRKPFASIESLKRLIREGETSMRELAGKYAPKVSSSIKTWVEEGRKATDKGRKLIKDEAEDLLKELDQFKRKTVERYVERAAQAITRHGLTRHEVLDLTKKIDALNRKLDELDGRGKGRSARATARPKRRAAKRRPVAHAEISMKQEGVETDGNQNN